MYKKTQWGILLGFFMFWGFLAAPKVLAQVSLSQEKGIYALGPFLQTLEDPEHQWDIEDLTAPTFQEPFTLSDTEVPVFGYTPSAYWVKLPLHHASEIAQDWLLELRWPNLDYIEFYEPQDDGTYRQTQTGDRFPFAQRELAYHNFLFRLNLNPDEHKTIYLRIITAGSLQLPMTLWHPSAFAEKINQENHIQGIYYGLMIAMLLYNFFLFTTIRDKAYLYYVFFIGFFTLAQLSINGLAFEYFWPTAPLWGNLVNPLLFGGAVATLALFAKTFLQTKIYSPFMDKVFIAFIVLGCSVASLSFFVGYRNSILAIFIQVPFLAVALFTAGILCWRRGYTPARLFLLAWIVFIVGLAFRALHDGGVLPSTWFIRHADQMGSALEVILLSLSLGDRINQFRREKYVAQQEALIAQKQQLKSQEEAIHNLEQADRLKAELNRQVSHQLNTLNHLNLVGSMLAQNNNIVQVFQSVFMELKTLLFAEVGVLYLAENKQLIQKISVPAAESSNFPEHVSLGKDTFGAAASLQETIVVDAEEGEVSSMMCVPLVDDDMVLGVVGVVLPFPKISPDSEPWHITETLCRFLSISVKNIQLIEETREIARMETELKTAAAVQKALFPQQLPQVDRLEFASYFQSATETGGDWYGFMTQIEGYVFVMIGDVTGHGTPAALVTATASATTHTLELLHQIDPSLSTPSHLLSHLNQTIYNAGYPDFLMTFFLARIDLSTLEVQYANAGHNFPMVVHPDKTVSYLLNANQRLGYQKDATFKENRIQLQEGDLLFLYTDGLIENTNPKGKEWGLKNMKRFLKEHTHLSAPALTDTMVHEIYEFFDGHPIEDDLTLLACKVL